MKIEISSLCKSFDGKMVLNGLNLTLTDEQPWCLMSPSGSGKTTLLRLILGLTKPDFGEISYWNEKGRMENPPRFSAVFQEDRLCEGFSPVENLMLAIGGGGRSAKAASLRAALEQELSQLLPPDCLNRPVCTFSGGMKRRTAICRAMISPSQIVLMDEPFTGLDTHTREMVIRYVLNRLEGRLLAVATHQAEEVKLLGGRVAKL